MRLILALTIGAALLAGTSGVSNAGQEDFFWVKDWSPKPVVIACSCAVEHTSAPAAQTRMVTSGTRILSPAPNY